MFVNTLSGRFLILSVIFVMLAEVLIFVPSVARFRQDYLMTRLEKSQIAALSAMAAGHEPISTGLEQKLLDSAGVYNIVLRRDVTSQLVVSSPIPDPVTTTVNLVDPSAFYLIKGALLQLVSPAQGVIRAIGGLGADTGQMIEVAMPQAPLRQAMIDYGLRILQLSAIISIVSAFLLYLAVRRFMVRPIRRVVDHMQVYSAAPEDARRIIVPEASITELRQAEDTLAGLQTQLTGALKQKQRLAQLGSAVAKISHDLRNILTTATLLADRMERSDDPAVKRSAPKLINSLSRAVHLCEGTLAFGRAEEPAPTLSMHRLTDIVTDVLESERLASSGSVQLVDEVPAQMMVRCDSEQLFRVLTNLVRNARQAIDATETPGRVTISAVEKSDDWTIKVSDTGPGLPPKAQEHLFTPFEGGVRQGGTGLGLVIAAELARGHGGTLSLVKTDADGTEFAIQLPKQVFDFARTAQ